MAFDATFLSAVLDEICQTATSARVEKIHQPARDTVIFLLRGNAGRQRLVIVANPTAPRLHFTNQNWENPDSPPMFCMLLRKHLSGGRLVAIEQPPMERMVRFVESDMLEAFGPEERFDVIVSNPPYIPTRVIEGLEPEVRDHEPRLALDGAEDGLKFYRILAEKGREHLAAGGYIYMEIGWDQAEPVTELFGEAGYRDVTVTRDMAGLNRVVRAVWPGKGEEEDHV